MNGLIDFDDPNTFPKILNEWGAEFEHRILSAINLDRVSEWWQIEHQLQDLHIGEMKIVTDFVDEHMDTEVAVCHCTRILDVNQFWKYGIVTGGGINSVGEKRLRDLLFSIEVEPEQIENIMSHVYYYWNRDKLSRTEAVHFFIDKNQVYKDDQLNHFAINLGGEILRWALESMDRELYRTEPYKRLWIKGTPSVIKFKCRLRDIYEGCRNDLIAEIVKYYIVKDIYGYPYEFEFTGMTKGKVPPENIISIEEIKGYIQMQEKYPDYVEFYNEIE